MFLCDPEDAFFAFTLFHDLQQLIEIYPEPTFRVLGVLGV